MVYKRLTDAIGSSEAVEESLGENSPDSQSHLPLRANTTTQVCWHRTTTVGMGDMQAMLKVASLTCTILCIFFILFFLKVVYRSWLIQSFHIIPFCCFSLRGNTQQSVASRPTWVVSPSVGSPLSTTVGWVTWLVKIVPNMTDNVFGGLLKLNPTLLLLYPL